MKKILLLLVGITVLTVTCFSQLNWFYYDFPSYTNNPFNNFATGLFHEKTIVKTDASGNVYSLVNRFNDASNSYIPTLEKEDVNGGIVFQKNDITGDGTGNQFFIVDMEVSSTGQSFCLISLYNGTGYRTVSYDASGNFLWKFDVNAHDHGSSANLCVAADLAYKNNKVYSLSTLSGYPNSSAASCRYSVVNLSTTTQSYSDTTPSSIAVAIDVSNSGVWVASFGAVYRKWCTSIYKFKSTNNTYVNNSSSITIWPTRGDRSEIPYLMKCSPKSGLPYVICVSSDTLTNTSSGIGYGTPNSWDVMIIKPKTAGNTSQKYKVYTISKGTDIPNALDFNSLGDILIAGNAGKSGFVTSVVDSTLAQKWVKTVAIKDSAAFTATAIDGDKYAVLATVLDAAGSNMNVNCIKFNVFSGGYSGIAAGPTLSTGDKLQVSSAAFSLGSKINFGGTVYVSASASNSLLTGQYEYSTLPVPPGLLNNPFRTAVSASNISAVQQHNNYLKAQIYPNPATNIVNLNFTSAESTTATITVFDASGKQVITQQQHVFSGINLISLNVSRLIAGNYYVLLQSAKEEIRSSFIKQ